MIVRFDSLNRFELPKLTLCNPGSTWKDGATSNTIGVLTGTSDEEIVFNFNATSTLSFRANLIEREDQDENAYVHRIYNSLQNRRSIFVEDIGYFVITNIEDTQEREYCYKDITAQSCEIELQNKGLTYIENKTYAFDDIFEKIVSSLPKWRIGSVDSAVSEKHRTFEEINYTKNTLAFMLEDMQDAYECIFVFDIINRVISVYDQNSYMVNTSIHITHKNVMRHLKVSENSDNLYTAVTAKGGDTITISAINPLGNSTVYNFDYYLDWMSDGLRQKVQSWSALVKDSQATYAEMNEAYYSKLQEEHDAQAEDGRLNSLRAMYKNCRDNIVATSGYGLVDDYNAEISEAGGEEIDISEEINDTLAVIDGLISDVDDLIAANQTALNTITKEKDLLNKDIEAIHNSVDITKYFTQDEYDELSDYIYEGNYNDQFVVFTEEMDYDDKFEQMKTLYNRTMEQLRRVSVPTQEFTADVESFLFAKEFLPWSEQLQTGCLINVELKPGDVAALFLSSMTINYADESMSLTFGNRFNKFDPKTLFENVLGNISKSANTIEYIKELTSPMKDGTFNAFAEALKTSRTLTMNAALSATNQAFTMDAAGITGKKDIGDGEFDPRQVKLVNNSMVFTSDAWETCHTAIGEVILDDGTVVYGINADTIMGRIMIANKLAIVDENGTPIFTVMDNKVSTAIGDSEDNMHTYIDVTAEGIKAVTAASVEQYDESEYDISYYGYVSPPNADVFPPSKHKNKYYLDRTSGKVYRSNGSSWVYVKTLNAVDANLSTKIDVTAEGIRTEVNNVQTSLDGAKKELSSSISQTAEEIRSTVANSTTKWDTTGYSVSVSGSGEPDTKMFPPSEYNGALYLDQANGVIYKSNGSVWSVHKSGLKKTTDVIRSEISQTADEIRSTVAGAVTKYDTSGLSYNITYYGYGAPTSADNASVYPANSSNNGKYYLNQNNGYVYYCNGSSWSHRETLKTITSALQSQIQQTAGQIKSTVAGAVSKYDTGSDTFILYGYGTPDSNGYSAKDYKGNYLDQNTGYKYTSNNSSSWTKASSPYKMITENLSSDIDQTAGQIKSTVAGAVSKYSIDSSHTIDYYGFGTPASNGYAAGSHSGKYYLDQSTGKRYYSNGSTWSVKNTYDLITSNLQSQINQKPDSITLSVSQNGNTAASINLKVDGEDAGSGSIDLSGLVTFSALTGNGTTEINGSNISTGCLDAENVAISGALYVYEDSELAEKDIAAKTLGKQAGGNVGYLSGYTGVETTSGIGVSADANHYLIASSRGVRMQAGDYGIYVTDTGVGSAGVQHKDYGFNKQLNSAPIAQRSSAVKVDGLQHYNMFAIYLTPINGEFASGKWIGKSAPIIAMKQMDDDNNGVIIGAGGGAANSLGSSGDGVLGDCRELHFINLSITSKNMVVANEIAAYQVESSGRVTAKQSPNISKIVGII